MPGLNENKDFSKEIRKLKSIVRKVPKDRRAIAENLLTEITFMAATLEELRRRVTEGGVVDLFKQGKQQFMRESPALKAYNATIPKYSLLHKQLADMLPKAAVPEDGGALLAFLKKGQA
jgi:hypothetical protein